MTVTVEMNSEEFLEFTKFQKEKKIDNSKYLETRRRYFNICEKIIKAYGLSDFELKDTDFAELQAAYPELLKEVLTEAYESLE